MRMKWMVSALALVASSPAAADVTARYSSMNGAGPPTIVQVNDRGDSRVASGNQTAMLTVNGVTYMLMADLSGSFAVRWEDVTAVMGERFRALSGPERVPTPPAPVQAEFAAVETGAETVAGRSGRVWVLRRQGEDTAPARGAFDFVISADPDLAPIGRVLARLYGLSTQGLRGMAGPDADAAGFGDAMRSIFERGTAIRIGRVMTFQSVETGPIPPSAFTLPGEPLSRAQFAERMGFPAQP